MTKSTLNAASSRLLHLDGPSQQSGVDVGWSPAWGHFPITTDCLLWCRGRLQPSQEGPSGPQPEKERSEGHPGDQQAGVVFVLAGVLVLPAMLSRRLSRRWRGCERKPSLGLSA